VPKSPVTSRITQSRRARLSDQIVLFLDILGSASLATDARAAANLTRLSEALRFAHSLALTKGEDQPYRVVTFTDNVVLGWPVARDAVSELYATLREAASFQYALTRFGLFVRGGLTRGPHYMSEDLVFGPALIDAYNLERSVAVYPRIVLGRRAIELVQNARRRKGQRVYRRLARLLWRSGEGETFLNYLDVVRADSTSARSELLRHRLRIEQALVASTRSTRVWEKYRWLADYHDHFCRTHYRSHRDLLIGGKASSTRFSDVTHAL